MLLSIITVNYRSWSHLDNLLADIGDAPELADGRWEVIVVDNDSGDDKLAAFSARWPKIRFVANSGNFGFAHGNNLGAGYATGDSLLFMNPDVRAEVSAIRTLLATRRAHPEIAMLTALQTDQNGNAQKAFDRFPDLLTYIRTIRGLLRFLRPARTPVQGEAGLSTCDWISGSLLLVDRTDFDALGGWCEDFWMYAEDMDFCRRAANHDMARACTGACRFIHVHGGASRRDEATVLLTKTEVMISAHVYISRHFHGLHQWLNHAVVLLRNLVPLTVAAVLNVFTIGSLNGLRRRAKLLMRMLAYYYSALRNHTWLSPRSANYPTSV